jgi:hypothetical protein
MNEMRNDRSSAGAAAATTTLNSFFSFSLFELLKGCSYCSGWRSDLFFEIDNLERAPLVWR